jgi:hypothetical protein
MYPCAKFACGTETPDKLQKCMSESSASQSNVEESSTSMTQITRAIKLLIMGMLKKYGDQRVMIEYVGLHPFAQNDQRQYGKPTKKE